MQGVLFLLNKGAEPKQRGQIIQGEKVYPDAMGFSMTQYVVTCEMPWKTIQDSALSG